MMESKLERLEAEALIPSRGERAALARTWLASLDEVEDARAAEVERRIADVEAGAVRVIPIAEALSQVRASLE